MWHREGRLNDAVFRSCLYEAHPVRNRPGRQPHDRDAGPLALNGELGLLVEAARRTTVSTAESLRATSPSTRWMVSLAARAGFSWSPWSRIRASVRGGADLVLTRHAYKIDSAVAAPSPHWVRPRVELELAADIW